MSKKKNEEVEDQQAKDLADKTEQLQKALKGFVGADFTSQAARQVSAIVKNITGIGYYTYNKDGSFTVDIGENKVVIK